MVSSAKITRKGQVTIPRKIREKLGADVVEFEWIDGVVTLRPVKSVAGALQGYAGAGVPFGEARERAWEEAASERNGKKAD
jgi:AbrB family looped-hinge helix DNA binding protein